MSARFTPNFGLVNREPSMLQERKASDAPIDENLSYYSLTYGCKHGGRTHKSVSTGARPKQT
ncbi:hypothetical protein HPB49_021236 [Dermacentor silvarum]|uniref:Uncharacterized protein n=1 Tax=Dermacentor silvarum TaxID=543639 RepID=A0ACB8CMS1_DERSI|nr:hypothetical protein HPB49_021236 [Dermacentor silvarum]